MILGSSWLGRLTAAWLVLAASAAGAKPLTLDRLLSLEDLGASALSPDGRHVVIETQAPYDQAPRFDFETPAASLGRLRIADLRSGGPARLLFPPEPGAGYMAGPFSPSGQRMIVHRWKDRRWTTGVAELDTGAVRWLDFGVDQALYGRSLQWLSDAAFVAIALPAGDAPLHIKLAWQNQARSAALWEAQALGAVSTLKVISSGRARSPTPRRDRALVRFDLVGGVKTVLAQGGFFDLELSPSGRFVAALGEAEPIGLVATPAVRMSAPGRRRALTLVDLRDGRVTTPCGACTTLIQPMIWAPRGDRLLVYQHDARRSEQDGALSLVDAARGRITAVAGGVRPRIDYGGEGFATVRAAWLGDQPVVFGRKSAATRDDWHLLSGAAGVNLTARLAAAPPELVASRDSGLLGLVAGTVWRIERSGAVSARALTGEGWWRPASFGTGARLAAVPLLGASTWLRTSTGLADVQGHALGLEETATPVAITPDAVLAETRAPDGELWIKALSRTGGPARDLVHLNADLADLDLGEVRTLETPGTDGALLKSWVLLPPGWRPGQRPPLIVVPYPGSAPRRYPARLGLKSNNLAPSPPLLAARGYAVLIPALPRDRQRGEPAEGLADQILAIVDAAVARGYGDPDRLALWGHSFGGYAALVTATQSDRFKAIIAQAGPADFLANWGEVHPYYLTAPEDGAPNPNGMGYNETGQGALKGPPWVETARYVRNSPFYQADKITAPVMLIYADQDFVGLTQGQAMFNALYRQDKDATLVTLVGEGHLPTSPANIRALYDEVMPWLAERLASPVPGPVPGPAAAREATRPSQ